LPDAASTLLRNEFPDCIGEWTQDISIGEGWLPLVRGLCRYLQGMSADSQVPPARMLQVKEKFGGLRFYVDDPTEEQSLVIGFAEMLSLSICERCGAMRDVTVEGAWRKALCPQCRGEA
jgi:hypothetical protein